MDREPRPRNAKLKTRLVFFFFRILYFPPCTQPLASCLPHRASGSEPLPSPRGSPQVLRHHKEGQTRALWDGRVVARTVVHCVEGRRRGLVLYICTSRRFLTCENTSPHPSEHPPLWPSGFLCLVRLHLGRTGAAQKHAYAYARPGAATPCSVQAEPQALPPWRDPGGQGARRGATSWANGRLLCVLHAILPPPLLRTDPCVTVAAEGGV